MKTPLQPAKQNEEKWSGSDRGFQCQFRRGRCGGSDIGRVRRSVVICGSDFGRMRRGVL